MNKIEINNNHLLIIDTTSARGGVTYHRSTTNERAIGTAVETDLLSTRRVDNVDLVKESDQIVSAARVALRRRCAITPLGLICEKKTLDALDSEIEEIKIQGEEFNARSRQLGSARRIRVGFVPIEIEIDNVVAAREITRAIRETLEELRNIITSGCERVRFNNFLQTRCKNLHAIGGIQQFAILDAIEAAKAARSEVTKAKKAAKKVGEEFNMSKLDLDLEAIDSAIDMFADI